MPADTQNRALGILIGYAIETFGIKLAQLGSPFVSPTNKVLYPKVNPFLRGERSLPEADYRIALQMLARVLTTEKAKGQVRADYRWLRPLLRDTGLEALLEGERDEAPLDHDLLHSLNLDPVAQTLERQRRLHELIGGVWYVIRQSTEDIRELRIGTARRHTAGEEELQYYNVSLLNIKPTEYTSHENNYEEVRTHLCHFSMRSSARGGAQEATQLYRGRVIEVDDSIYFIGDRYQINRPKIFTMVWAIPRVEQRGRRNLAALGSRPDADRAEWAEGVVTTVNSSDVTITCPMVAQHIQHVPGMVTRPRGAGRAAARADADWYQQLLDLAQHHIGLHPATELTSIVSDFSDSASIRPLIPLLEDNVAEGRERGHFRLAGR